MQTSILQKPPFRNYKSASSEGDRLKQSCERSNVNEDYKESEEQLANIDTQQFICF